MVKKKVVLANRLIPSELSFKCLDPPNSNCKNSSFFVRKVCHYTTHSTQHKSCNSIKITQQNNKFNLNATLRNMMDDCAYPRPETSL